MAGRVERVGVRLGHRRAGLPLELLPPPAPRPDGEPLDVGDLGGPRLVRGLLERPGHLGAAHRRAEEVAGADGGDERVAVEAGNGVGGDVHQEFGRAILGDAVAGRGELLPLALPLETHADLVIAERRRGGDSDRLLQGAERRRRQHRLLEHALLPILEHDADRVAAGRGPERAEQAGADDRLGEHRVAGAVDPPLGEDRGGGGEPLVAPGGEDIEAPGRKVRVPLVDADQGAVGAAAHLDVAVERLLFPVHPPVPGALGRRPAEAAQPRHAARIGDGAP